MNVRNLILGVCVLAGACSTPQGSGRDAAGGTGGGRQGDGGSGGAGTSGAAGTGKGTAGMVAGQSGAAGIAGQGGTGNGTAGTVAGQSGAGGIAGQGGGGGLAACTYSSFSAGAGIVDESGTSRSKSFSVTVTVVSSDDCGTGGTPGTGGTTGAAGTTGSGGTTATTGGCGSSHPGARRIVLAEAGGPRWTMYAYFSALPADIVEVGEALDLQQVFRDMPTGVGSVYSSSAVLSRAGTAVVFDVVAAADLVPFGIAVVSSPTGRCMRDACYASSGADVTYEMETRSVGPGQTVNIGKLSFTHGGFDTWAAPWRCGDSLMSTQSMTGFIAR